MLKKRRLDAAARAAGSPQAESKAVANTQEARTDPAGKNASPVLKARILLPEFLGAKPLKASTSGTMLANRDCTRQGGQEHHEVPLAWENAYAYLTGWLEQTIAAETAAGLLRDEVVDAANAKYTVFRKEPPVEMLQGCKVVR